MLKKFGLVAVGVTASLAAFGPLASAEEHGQGDCSVTSTDGKAAQGPVNECNTDFGQHNGEGNTVNGIPIGLPGTGNGQSGGVN